MIQAPASTMDWHCCIASSMQGEISIDVRVYANLQKRTHQDILRADNAALLS
jgi:hypothetical protein